MKFVQLIEYNMINIVLSKYHTQNKMKKVVAEIVLDLRVDL